MSRRGAPCVLPSLAPKDLTQHCDMTDARGGKAEVVEVDEEPDLSYTRQLVLVCHALKLLARSLNTSKATGREILPSPWPQRSGVVMHPV